MAPCGSITSRDPLGGNPNGWCFTCGGNIGNYPNEGLYVEEWDAVIHRYCLGDFLVSPEGIMVLEHGHEVIVPEVGLTLDET